MARKGKRAAAGRMGPAAAQLIHRRTGAEALEAATGPATAPAWKHGEGKNQAGFKVTTIRFVPAQWKWLRQQALARALDSGTMADASEIVRELVAAAMAEKAAR